MRLVGSDHPRINQGFQLSVEAYVSAIPLTFFKVSGGHYVPTYDRFLELAVKVYPQTP